MRNRQEQDYLDYLLLEACENSKGILIYKGEDGANYEATISELIEYGANPQAYDQRNGTLAIMFCAKMGNHEGYKILADLSNFETTNASGSTILHCAIIGGNSEIIADVVDRAPNIIDWRNSANETALTQAINQGNNKALKILLDAGVSPNSSSRFSGQEMTILVHAISCGNNEAVRILVDAGADTGNILYDSYLGRDISLLERSADKNKRGAINSIVSCLDSIAERGVENEENLAIVLRDLENPVIQQFLDKKNTLMIAVILNDGDSIIERFDSLEKSKVENPQIFTQEERALISNLRQLKEKMIVALESAPINQNLSPEIALCIAMTDLIKNVQSEEDKDWRKSAFKDRYPSFSEEQNRIVNKLVEEFYTPAKTPEINSYSHTLGDSNCIVM
jgi:ankyrin repeat protein